MLITALAWAAVALILATSTGLLISRDWRWSLGLLAVQYLALFILVDVHWPTGMAAAKLVTGWMAVAVLGISRIGLAEDAQGEASWPQSRLFRLLAAALVVMLALAVTPRVPVLLPGIELPAVAGGMLLLGIGLLHLGITAQPLRVITGLLTVLAGFEVLYASVEGSILVAALLAGVTLGLALVGAYLLTAAPPPPVEQDL